MQAQTISQETFSHPHITEANRLEQYLNGFAALDRTVAQLERTAEFRVDQHVDLQLCLASLTCHLDQVLRQMTPAELSGAIEQLAPRFEAGIMQSGFGKRALTKPLGYAGDYMMVQQIWNNQEQGNGIGRLIDRMLLDSNPSVAHRNRIRILEDLILDAARKAQPAGRACRVLNIGCGPAIEVRNFIRNHPDVGPVEFTLIDFNEETLQFAETEINQAIREGRGLVTARFVQQSVMDIVRQSIRAQAIEGGDYDLVYCAGLYDYLEAKICLRLNQLFYLSCRSGGCAVVTNVGLECPGVFAMQVLMRWSLITRDLKGMRKLIPAEVAPECVELREDKARGNIFLVMSKP